MPKLTVIEYGSVLTNEGVPGTHSGWATVLKVNINDRDKDVNMVLVLGPILSFNALMSSEIISGMLGCLNKFARRNFPWAEKLVY